MLKARRAVGLPRRKKVKRGSRRFGARSALPCRRAAEPPSRRAAEPQNRRTAEPPISRSADQPISQSNDRLIGCSADGPIGANRRAYAPPCVASAASSRRVSSIASP
ncbi:hypothetical protein VU09_33285 [Burkholderia pseudomallei]|nr:hypothetical protein VU09_33285 [Burkholderia pseudomallei]